MKLCAQYLKPDQNQSHCLVILTALCSLFSLIISIFQFLF